LKRQTQLFFTKGDELAFSKELKDAEPRVRFIDDNVWNSAKPQIAESIAACRSHFAFIWNPVLVEELPVVRRRDGLYEGPNSGPVIQYVRSLEEEGMLRSGRLASGVDEANKRMLGFVELVWCVLAKVARPGVATLDGETADEYWVGTDCLRWLRADPTRKLRDRSTSNYYLPKPMGD
jgi:hypothetical protein